MVGPTLAISKEIFAAKYAQMGESFDQAMHRIADALADDRAHYEALLDILANQRFLPGGRIQAGAGSARAVTLLNCFVLPVEDSMEGIMKAATEAAMTMRMGGGCGYNFSKLRPKGSLIKTLESQSSGPVSFMGIFDSVCKTIASAGHRRGAQMGILSCEHPDIEEFVHAKQNSSNLTAFNISVGVTDKFMDAVKGGMSFDLQFNGRVHKTVDARKLWNEIMRSTWDWAEPGVVFLERINALNNLQGIEEIIGVNPCSEIPLPAYGACLLGSFNLPKYVQADKYFNIRQLTSDIPHVVRALDNVVDRTIYPLDAQRQEHFNTRRMGIGVTGLANAFEAMEAPYGSSTFIDLTDNFFAFLKNGLYMASTSLAREKGAFPLYCKERYLNTPFIMSLAPNVRNEIAKYGIRNSHLTACAPTGTISLAANNVSSGIEPVFAHEYTRVIQAPTGPRIETVADWGLTTLGIRGKVASECTVDEHLKVLLTAQKHVDQAISKTINIGEHVTFEDFKDVYSRAYAGGAKAVSTFRLAGKRAGILQVASENAEAACTYDPSTGERSCAA